MLARRRSALGLAVGFACLALAGSGGAARAGTQGDPACGSNQFTSESGQTNATTHSSTRFSAAQVTPSSLGGGKVSWNVRGTITGQNTGPGDGDLSGFLDVVIDWNQDRPNTEFHSSCVGSVTTQIGFIAFEYLGLFTNFPSAQATGGGPNAYAEISFKRTGTPEIADLDLRMDFGDLCAPQEPSIRVQRPDAHAPGHKTGNGNRNSAQCN